MKTSNLGAMVALVFCIFAKNENAMADLATGIAAYLKGDFSGAKQELTPEAENGNAEAQIYLGRIYEHPIEGKQDAATALKWYQIAANQGNHTAEEIVGLSYFNGRGVSKDIQAAWKWLQAAADGGRASAQYQVGSLYSQGLGVAQNNQLALKWFRMRAERHNPFATNSLGLAYQNGLGVGTDKTLALTLFMLSASYGPMPLDNAIKNIEKDMAQTEINSARNLSCALRNAQSLITALDA